MIKSCKLSGDYMTGYTFCKLQVYVENLFVFIHTVDV